MWNPASLMDRKAYLGMGMAAVVGLSFGGYMKPVLKISDGPEGPQLLMPASAARAAYVDERSAFTSYRFGIPDFVVGTDWLAPPMPAVYDAAPEPEPEPAYETASYEAPTTPIVIYDQFEPPRTEPSYPSMGGDILASVTTTPAPPPPPEDTAGALVVDLPPA